MGAEISGAGGPVITIQGVKRLHGVRNYPVIPDRIEAGTFLLAAAITQSPMRVEPVIPEHLSAVLQKLRDCGCQLDIDQTGISITPGEIQAVDITTQPFPGFPTDLQAPFMALMTTAKGTSVISEKIYENRLQHVAELQRMGASIRVESSTAIVEGVAELSAAPVTGSDLRAAAWCWRPGGKWHHQVSGLSTGPWLRQRRGQTECRRCQLKATAKLKSGHHSIQSLMREPGGIGRRSRLKISRPLVLGFKSPAPIQRR